MFHFIGDNSLVNSQLFTMVAMSCGICGKECGIGAGFLRVIQFLPPIPIPQTAPYSSKSSSGADIIGPLLADVPSVPSFTTPHELKQIN
jgi:hypothetical protein